VRKVAETITEVEREIVALRNGKGRSRTGTVELYRQVLDAFLAAGFEPARQAGCRCSEEQCKYPMCAANRS